MRFVTIDATEMRVELVSARGTQECYKLVGLDPKKVDHGTAATGVAIVVHGLGLWENPETTKYFSIGSKLFAGNAVLYGYDAEGETINLNEKPPVIFYRSHYEVEAAIQRGEIERPCMLINGETIWQWPDKVRR
jgi:hypothetical protein